MTSSLYLYGRNPLKETLLAKKRGQPFAIKRLLLTKASEENPEIMSLVQTHNVAYEIVTNAEIESFVGKDTVHQGVCAELLEKTLYTPMEEVLAAVSKKEKNAVFVLLDELQDPHNVGAIIRTAVAFGADAILIPEHDQTQISGTVIKTSTGMNFAIPIVRIGNINTTLSQLKEKGFWTYGLAASGTTSLPEAKFDTHTVIVVGNESTGIRMKTLEICDFTLSIPISPLCESLNASNAAAVTLYEWSTQNK